MNYVKVESSQIAEVGYDAETETLGIKFPAGKRSPASEYRYANVPARVHRALITAESIGSYFGQTIKSRPDLYPYVKVETDPQKPSVGVVPNTQAVQEDTNGDQPSPGTALTIIDTMADDLLFTPGAVTDAQLAAGREWYLNEAKKYDITTEKSRTELKRFARPLQKLRTGIEARAKELTGATKRKIAAIDAEKRRLVMLVGGIEDEVLRPLTEWEQEEESRKVRLSGIVTSLGEHVTNAIYPNIASLEETIAKLESFDTSTMQEYKVSAESAIAASLKILKPELERRKVAEAQAAELEQLRAEKAERDRKDEIAREAERLAAKKVEAVAEQVRQETRQEVIAELATPIDLPPVEVQPFISSIPDIMDRGKTEADAIGALVEHCLIDPPAAMEVVAAISKGLIPHVTITY
jgi:hypothetical protein